MSNLKVYPLDLTGTNPSNKISGEIIKITTEEDRIFIPYGGAFYAKSLKIWVGNKLLTRDVDYHVITLHRNATLQSGKEVCTQIKLNHRASSFVLEYQVIGGEYVNLNKMLIEAIKNTPINEDYRIRYEKILNKPKEFPPSEHSHAETDWIGYEQAIKIIKDINRLIPISKKMITDLITEVTNKEIKKVVTNYFATGNRLAVYVSDIPSPNGFFGLKGTGNNDDKLRIDYNELFGDLDARYFTKHISPLTRVGKIDAETLPMTKFLADDTLITVLEDFPVLMSEIFDYIEAGNYDITDVNHSDIDDFRDKKILIYITLENGKPKLWFSETSIPESSYNVYIGYLMTDDRRITELNVKPVTRLGNYRLSLEPIGSAISVSPDTPDKVTNLNWDTGKKKRLETPQPTTKPESDLHRYNRDEIFVTVSSLNIKPGEVYQIKMIGGGGSAAIESERASYPRFITIGLTDTVKVLGHILPLVYTDFGKDGTKVTDDLQTPAGVRYLNNENLKELKTLDSTALNNPINYLGLFTMEFKEFKNGEIDNKPSEQARWADIVLKRRIRNGHPNADIQGSGGVPLESRTTNSYRLGASGAYSLLNIRNITTHDINLVVFSHLRNQHPDAETHSDIRNGLPYFFTAKRLGNTVNTNNQSSTPTKPVNNKIPTNEYLLWLAGLSGKPAITRRN